MTPAERKSHIKKRQALAILHHRRARLRECTFSSKALRPILKRMSYSCRKAYLKNLLKLAATDPSAYEIAPFDIKAQFSRGESTVVSSLSRLKVKSILRTSRKLRKGANIMYKGLTCTSIASQAATKLTY